MGTSSEHRCACWVAVLATILILVSLADMLYGVLFGALVDELASLQSEVKDNAVGLGVAGFFRSITGGLINFGDSQLGAIVRPLVEKLPDLRTLESMALARVVVAGIGVLLGIGLAMRLSWIAWAVAIYTTLNLAFGIVMVIEALDIYRILAADPIKGDAILIGSIDVVLHVFWPLAFGLRLLAGRGTGALKKW
jgi:hypothetical protein